MNDWFALWGLSWLKGLLSFALLSPLPLIAFVALGLVLRRRLPRLGVALAAAGLLVWWTASTAAFSGWAIEALTRPPPPLDEAAIARLTGAPRTAIVVLGAGRRDLAPEYGGPDLKPFTIERLRYGLWLARRTGLPALFSGGNAWNGLPGPSEAQIAAEVAARDFGVALRWREDRSRDTAENATHTIALLHPLGIDRYVIVTHGFHQQRARAAFERAAARQGVAVSLVSAGVGLRPDRGRWEWSDFLPSASGYGLTMLALHEWLGWLAGA